MFEATSDLGDWHGPAKLTPVVTVVDDAATSMRFSVSLDGTAPRAFLNHDFRWVFIVKGWDG